MRPYPQETANLITSTEEILDGKLDFVCSVSTELVPLLIHDGHSTIVQLFN